MLTGYQHVEYMFVLGEPPNPLVPMASFPLDLCALALLLVVWNMFVGENIHPPTQVR